MRADMNRNMKYIALEGAVRMEGDWRDGRRGGRFGWMAALEEPVGPLNAQPKCAVSCRLHTAPCDILPANQGRQLQLPLELDLLFGVMAAFRGGHGPSSWRCLLSEERRSGSAHQASDGALSIPQQALM